MAVQPKGIKITADQLNSSILSKIHTELGRRPAGSVAAFDTHIKGVCDVHGKGDHIKGAGPNYYKTSTMGDLDRVLTDYHSLVERLAVDVAKKIRGGGPG